MKYFLIRGAIRDGEHDYTKLMVYRRRSLDSKKANELFVDRFGLKDWRHVGAEYFHEITKVEFEILKKYL